MLCIYRPGVNLKQTEALPPPSADPWPRLKAMLCALGQEAGSSPALLALLTEFALVAHAQHERILYLEADNHHLCDAVAGRLP